MRSLVYYVATTLDGYIAGPDGAYEFFGLADDLGEYINARYPETMPTAYRQALGRDDAPNGRFDTVVMGRGTYEPAFKHGITSPYAHLRQIVFSRTLPPQDGVEVTAADPVTVIRELKQQDGGDIWLCGGGELAGRLLDEIDEFVVKLNPIVAGDGIPLVRHGFDPRRLELADTRPFGSGVVLLQYLSRAGRG